MYFLATLSLPPSSLLKLCTISYISEDRKLKRKQKNQEQEQFDTTSCYNLFCLSSDHNSFTPFHQASFVLSSKANDDKKNK